MRAKRATKSLAPWFVPVCGLSLEESTSRFPEKKEKRRGLFHRTKQKRCCVWFLGFFVYSSAPAAASFESRHFFSAESKASSVAGSSCARARHRQVSSRPLSRTGPRRRAPTHSRAQRFFATPAPRETVGRRYRSLGLGNLLLRARDAARAKTRERARAAAVTGVSADSCARNYRERHTFARALFFSRFFCFGSFREKRRGRCAAAYEVWSVLSFLFSILQTST